ncbi:MAG TPA: hypothetical protein DCK85_11175 [Ktedonobacter sp.]|nr:hypothetical protein [Ktedonobacter sp.]
MTCPQCNAVLPESATFCHSCGSPIRSVSFSYLPSGTPAWPSTIPQRPLASAGATAQAGQEKISPTKPLPSRPKRSARSVLIITALFILIPLVGIGATLGTLWFNGEIPVKTVNSSIHVPPAPTQQAQTQQTPGTSTGTPTTPAQTNQLPTPASFQTATLAEVGATLKYPTEWVKDAPQSTTNSVVLAFHPQQKNGIDLFVERFTSTTSAKLTSTNDVNQNNLTSIQNAQGITNFHTISSSSTQVTIGGAQWDEQDATFSTTQGTIFHLTTMAVQHNQLYYDILFYAPGAVYNEAVQKYFLPMLESFQFQS